MYFNNFFVEQVHIKNNSLNQIWKENLFHIKYQKYITSILFTLHIKPDTIIAK